MVSSPQAQMEKSLYTERHHLLTELLKKARKEAGLTQQDVADMLGKPQSFVAKYENGERRLDIIEFMDVAEALSVDPSVLLSRLKVKK